MDEGRWGRAMNEEKNVKEKGRRKVEARVVLFDFAVQIWAGNDDVWMRIERTSKSALRSGRQAYVLNNT